MLLVLPCLLITLLWWMFEDVAVGVVFDQRRAGAAGDVPVHHDVPGHQRDHAARALLRHARAAAGDADGQARLPRSATPSRSASSPRSSRRWPSRCRVGVLGLDVQGPVWLLTVVADRRRRARLGAGLFVSAFAKTEFQAVQFMPLFVIPQILLCGLFIARDQLPPVLEADQRRAAAVLRRRRDAGPGRRPARHGRGLARRRDRGRPSRSARWPSALPPCGGVRPDRLRAVGE